MLRNVTTVLAALLIAIGARAQSGPDITGTWTGSLDTPYGVLNYRFTFTIDGDKLVGKAKSELGDFDIGEGVVKGNQITFVEITREMNRPLRILYVGKIEGDQIRFLRKVGTGRNIEVGQFMAKRAKSE